MDRILAGLFNLVYPPQCLLCRKFKPVSWPQDVLCLECRENLVLNHPPFCPKCSRPLGNNPEAAFCADCRRYPIHFDFAWCASPYNETLRELIHLFKYHDKTVLRHTFAQHMIRFIEQYNFDIRQFECLIPVPLYHSRLRERGYNQSFLIAQKISDYFNIPLCTKALKRTRPTTPQAMLSPKERWTNIDGAFTISRIKDIENRSVLLIDDLLTTGATVCEAAKTLKEAGAETVGVLTLAITP